MTSEEKVHYWLDIAAYDIETAEAMYQTGRWLYVAFMCHQVIEKTPKLIGAALRSQTRHILTATNVWLMVADFML